MFRFSPKNEIINHFDSLINRVDIDIDLCLEKCNDQQIILSELLKSSEADRKNLKNQKAFKLEMRSIDSSKNNIWLESTKVIDYLKQIRMKTIEELRKAQEESLEFYALSFKSQLSDKNRFF